MENKGWVIYDGELIEAGKPVIPVESRGLMYGDGCFETFRRYREGYFKLDAHLQRLRSATAFLDMAYPAVLEKSSLKKQIGPLLRRNGLEEKDAAIRLQIWRDGSRGYHIQAAGAVHYAILATSLPKLSDALSLSTVTVRRIPDEALPSSFKLCNNINYITAARQAHAMGADEALMQTVEGVISETTIANIFWVTGDTVFTPSVTCDILPGVTRDVLITLLDKKEAIEIIEGEFELRDINKADAVWISNSLRELMPVSRVNDKEYEVNHSVLNELKSAFETYRNQEVAT